MEILHTKDRNEWCSWLKKYHNSKKEIWLTYYKKQTGKPRISYNDAVEEAICFGWIDGQAKSLGVEKYIQRYTPRKPKSSWSEINIGRAKKMIKERKMTKWGLEKYYEGMKNNRIVPSSKNFSIPLDLKEALAKNPKALNNFKNFAPSTQLRYVCWFNNAKREETRIKRVKEIVVRSQQNKKLEEI